MTMGVDTSRTVVILNPRSGPKRDNDSEAEVRASLGLVGIDPEIILLQNGVDVASLIRQRASAGCEVFVAAGGDGTINSVAAVLAGTQAALGILPMGTLNHFATDLGIPGDINAAAEVIARRETTLVDVGQVNGRMFVNNSSIGLYTTLVTEREKYMKRGFSKPVAAVLASLIALWRFPNTSVRVTTHDTAVATRTPLVLVGNNRYEFTGTQSGKRATLDDGLLQVSMMKQASRTALIKAALLAFGKVEAEPDMLILETCRAKVVTFRRLVRVALDGEVIRLRSPLEYMILPEALRVIVDRRETGKAEG
ncbi:MAG TPA: diacylglycerol kinase family protein [Bryobacteraceae bacterium]|nr:diacylglycerol kinase family protein [Bryobacteraceae bacterium]